jgi:ribosome-binding factor A
MTAPLFHNERTTEHLLREITWTIANRLNDPRVPEIVTVTEIKLAPDCRNATVYVSVYGSENKKKGALIALNRAAPFIQRCVASRVKMKHVPILYFKIDSSLDRSEHIHSLLEQIKDDLGQTPIDH